MGFNNFVYCGETKFDLRNDTVTPETLMEGVTAHDASGEHIVGTAKIPEIPDNYIDTSGATAGEFDIFNEKTAFVNGEMVTGRYFSRAINFQQSNVPDYCSWSTTEVRLGCDFEPTYLAIVLNSAHYTNNRVIAVWAIGTSAIVYHTKTSSGVARTQATSNVSSCWYYDSANKQVVVKSPSTSYLWSTYSYRYFLFK